MSEQARRDYYETLLQNIPETTKIVVCYTNTVGTDIYAVGNLHKENGAIYMTEQELYLMNDETRDHETTYKNQLSLSSLQSETMSSLKFGTNIRYESIKYICTAPIKSKDQREKILASFPTTPHIATQWVTDSDAIYIPKTDLSLITVSVTLASTTGPPTRVTEGNKILPSRQQKTYERKIVDIKPFDNNDYYYFSYKIKRGRDEDVDEEPNSKRGKRGGKKSKKSKTQRKSKKSNKSKKNKNQHK